jgi:hypothetical protein
MGAFSKHFREGRREQGVSDDADRRRKDARTAWEMPEVAK